MTGKRSLPPENFSVDRREMGFTALCPEQEMPEKVYLRDRRKRNIIQDRDIRRSSRPESRPDREMSLKNLFRQTEHHVRHSGIGLPAPGSEKQV